MYSIPDRLSHIKKVKNDIRDVISLTGQDVNVPFRQYAGLIKNIPNKGVMTPIDLKEFVELSTLINGEKA